MVCKFPTPQALNKLSKQNNYMESPKTTHIVNIYLSASNNQAKARNFKDLWDFQMSFPYREEKRESTLKMG